MDGTHAWCSTRSGAHLVDRHLVPFGRGRLLTSRGRAPDQSRRGWTCRNATCVACASSGLAITCLCGVCPCGGVRSVRRVEHSWGRVARGMRFLPRSVPPRLFQPGRDSRTRPRTGTVHRGRASLACASPSRRRASGSADRRAPTAAAAGAPQPHGSRSQPTGALAPGFGPRFSLFTPLQLN